MASKRKAFLSRSVSLSLAALIVLTGAMFLITTLEQDHQEWKLVDDEVLDLVLISSIGYGTSEDVDYTWEFDEETSTYNGEIISGDKSSSGKYQLFTLRPNDDFPFDADAIKFVFVSDISFWDFSSVSNGSSTGPQWFYLKNITPDDDGLYTATVVIHDQIIEDLKYKDSFWASSVTETRSTFAPQNYSVQVYVLEDDNAGSVAAAITGLTLIVMGVFATPMLNVFRRK